MGIDRVTTAYMATKSSHVNLGLIVQYLLHLVGTD